MTKNNRTASVMKDIMHLGIAHAGIALSQFLGLPLDFSIDSCVWLDPFREIAICPGWTHLQFTIKGNLSGQWWLVIDGPTQNILLNLCLERYFGPVQDRPGIRTSAVKEIGNILVSSFLTGLSNIAPGVYIPSIPGIVYSGTNTTQRDIALPRGLSGCRVSIRFTAKDDTCKAAILFLVDRNAIESLKEDLDHQGNYA